MKKILMRILHRNSKHAENINIDALVQFRDLKISRDRLTDILGKNPIHMNAQNPLYISAEHVLNTLQSYAYNKITLKEMIEWCDVVRFSDLFDYPDDEIKQEAVASVVDEMQDMEDIEVFDQQQNDIKIQNWIRTLEDVHK